METLHVDIWICTAVCAISVFANGFMMRSISRHETRALLNSVRRK